MYIYVFTYMHVYMYMYRLLIIATDGVWDMLDNSEVVDISARASGDCKGDPAYASAQVCHVCVCVCV
jgi:serine/threonine protein phosphatase PrpC